MKLTDRYQRFVITCHLADGQYPHRANAARTRFARLTAGMTPLFEVNP